MKHIGLVWIFVMTVIFSGCSTKNSKEEFYNKPSIFWYQKILKAINNDNLENADDYYTSLSSEHVESPFLKTAMLILAQAHADDEEYLLANFYYDEYIKRYGDSSSAEYVNFLKIKTNYNAFVYPRRDQMLLSTTIQDSLSFMRKYPHSIYNPLVQTMLTRLSLAQKDMYQQIISLYKRTSKPKAAKIYEEKLKNSWYKDVPYIKSHTAWYKKIFE